MSDTVHIPRATGDPNQKPPYWIATVDTKGNQCRPHVRCKCGDHTGIGLHHIHKDGCITASYYHKYPDAKDSGCGWHVYLWFDNYDQGEWLPNDDKPRVL